MHLPVFNLIAKRTKNANSNQQNRLLFEKNKRPSSDIEIIAVETISKLIK